MTRVAALLAPVILLLTALPLRPSAQPSTDGAALFGERCSSCHGADARGGNGPALVNLWTAGASDERVLRTIRQGVPGSAMPPSSAPDAELEAIVRFLKTLAAGASAFIWKYSLSDGDLVAAVKRVCGRTPLPEVS